MAYQSWKWSWNWKFTIKYIISVGVLVAQKGGKTARLDEFPYIPRANSLGAYGNESLMPVYMYIEVELIIILSFAKLWYDTGHINHDTQK